MKTLQELYTEVIASEELKKAVAQAAKDKKVADFLKAQGCDATEDEFKAFLVEKAKDVKALSEDELENVAGGSIWDYINWDRLKDAITYCFSCN